jgi:NADH-quinone oxidoreductase subunit E
MSSNYEKFQTVLRILEENDFKKSKLIPVLQAIQEQYKYLPEEILLFIAAYLNISPSKVYGVATFFTYFTLKSRGKHIIKICNGTACHVKKSSSIIDAVKRKLGLQNNEISTKNMLFTLETVACLGACGLAPVIVINNETYGQVTTARVVELIDDILGQEVQK